MKTLLTAKLWMLKNWVARMTYGDASKTLFFGLLGFFFLFFLYGGFVRVLWEVKNVPLVGPLLVVKLMAMCFLTMFSMIVFSSTLTSFTTLFFARDLNFLMHSPFTFRSVFLFKALETSVFSSWMVLLAILPFVLAYGHVYRLGAAFYLALAGLSVPFVMTACALGVGLSLALMCVFPSKRVREVMALLGITVGCGLYILFRWLEPEKLVRADSFDTLVQYITVLEAPVASYLPSWWMVSAVTALQSGRTGDAVFYSAVLTGAAVLAGAGLLFFAKKAYYNGWTTAQEAGRRSGPSAALGREWRWAPPFFGKRMRALLGKDGLLFVRDSNQWSQFLLLLALVAVYLLSIAKLPLDTPYLRGLVSFLNIGLVGFVLASVALRFVYPAVSLEGKSWWCLRAAPMSLWAVLWEKFWLGFMPLCAMGIALVWASNQFLGVDSFVVWLSNASIFLMAWTLSGMGVGFGALFPRFHVENIAQIESSPGGLLYMICALFYVGLTLSLEAVVMRMYYFSVVKAETLWRWEVAGWAAAGLLVLNVIAFTGPFVFGKWSLERVDA